MTARLLILKPGGTCTLGGTVAFYVTACATIADASEIAPTTPCRILHLTLLAPRSAAVFLAWIGWTISGAIGSERHD